jgi:hypothetical protein
MSPCSLAHGCGTVQRDILPIFLSPLGSGTVQRDILPIFLSPLGYPTHTCLFLQTLTKGLLLYGMNTVVILGDARVKRDVGWLFM